jgi:hypothetical protein
MEDLNIYNLSHDRKVSLELLAMKKFELCRLICKKAIHHFSEDQIRSLSQREITRIVLATIIHGFQELDKYLQCILPKNELEKIFVSERIMPIINDLKSELRSDSVEYALRVIPELKRKCMQNNTQAETSNSMKSDFSNIMSAAFTGLKSVANVTLSGLDMMTSASSEHLLSPIADKISTLFSNSRSGYSNADEEIELGLIHGIEDDDEMSCGFVLIPTQCKDNDIDEDFVFV